MYTLDTNIVIALFQGDVSVEAAVRNWHATNTPMITSTITLTELLAFPDLTSKEEDQLKAFLQTTRTVAVDWRIAELAGHIRRSYRVKIGDSIIAATAWHENSILVTRNMRDFRRVKTLRVESL